MNTISIRYMSKIRRDIKIEIMKLLLDTGEDLSVREIARRLDLTAGHVFYHLKRLYEMGILTKEEIEDRVYYTPQPIFTENIDDILNNLLKLSHLIKNPDELKIANCVTMFLKCYNTLYDV
jgi:DNA-binding transcriptional ArsR family regulator